ncbi:hypothetical protein HDC34_001888 [Pseudoclavibacter sp. JAI123]|uniref:hypothetical protein n=1 Tax=Pseudoclavibacter sp. JAI123 TaxID=2723065 RepID=UPI0015C7FFA4|nr:hypothetical protein [Pseudoclavibacter sp. JAI123]NYF13594.1 hypothetical protein [Pseudoclavibacter sp. JAI123]
MPLYDLRFAITDIDSAWSTSWFGTRDFVDGIVLESASSFVAEPPAGSSVTGDGTMPSPWRNANDGGIDENAPGGEMRVRFPGPVTSFTIRYLNTGYLLGGSPNTNNDQAVFVTGFTFERRGLC